jgi:hypothetical protein
MERENKGCRKEKNFNAIGDEQECQGAAYHATRRAEMAQEELEQAMGQTSITEAVAGQQSGQEPTVLC